MRLTRKLLAVVIALSMVLALVPTTAGAAGFQGLTEAEARKAQSDYLNSLGSSSAGNAHAPGLVVDGFQIPSDVAAMKSFKDGNVRVLVTVPGDTIAAYAVKHSSSLTIMTPSVAAPAVTKIKADQDASLQAVQARGVILKGVRRFSVLFNGYSAQIAVGDLGKLAEAVGRANVHFSRLTQLEDTNANTLIGADAVRTDPGVDGTGAYVGVCDTGVDYTHPDFGGDGTNHGFPTAKVVAGYDFAGDNAGAIDNPALIAPDHDPMDTNEHGTHVSGIIAADGAVTGVAPKAKIVFAKISPAGIGSAWSEEIIAAWEYMADPNNLDAGDEGSHPVVQSVNMSFGSVSGFDDPTDPERIAIENAIASGIVATLSAGNSGSHYASPFNYNFYPDYSTLGSPATTPGAISVASSENSTIGGFTVTETTAPGEYIYFTGSTSPDPIVSLGDHAGAGYQYVYCGLGRVPADGVGYPDDFAGLTLTGKIALIDRGMSSFFMKINNAAALGAVGVIIANNVTGGGPASMNTTGSTLTSLSVSKADGLTLRAKAAAPAGDGTGLLKFLGHSASIPNPSVDTISSFSSWGATPNLTFKPEVTAPGGNIWSTVPVAQGSYANLSGTSMAAPHVAGAAALIRLVHPTWTVEQVKTALMNTGALLIDPASPAHLPYSPRLQGAGRINVFNALHTDVTVTSQLDGKAAVTLGSVESWTEDAITFPLVLNNSGTTPVTYDVTGSVQWVNAGGTAKSYAIPGATFAASASPVTVAAGGTRTVTITVDARAVSPSSGYLPYIEGFVTFTPEFGVVLHVPYMGYLGNWNDFDSDAWAPTFNPLVDLPHWWNSYSMNFYGGDLGDTGVTWPEDPTNGWKQMGKTFTGDFDESTIAINPVRATGAQRGIENNIWVLRNIENLKIEVRDSSGQLIKLIDDVDNVWKGNYASYSTQYTWYWSGNALWQWYGEDNLDNTVADGQYYLDTVATAEKVINKLSYDAPQTVSFPVYVDTVNPVAAVTSVEAGTPGNWKVNFTGSDSGSGLWGYAVYYGTMGTDPATWAYVMVAPAAATSAEIPAGKQFMVVAYDNANNITMADQVFSDVEIMTTLLPSAAVDQSYSATIAATGGTGVYYFTLAGGTLPDELTLSSSGTISGTPLVAGDYPITIQVTDGNSVDTQAYTLVVYGSGLAITTPSPLPTGMINVPYYQVLSAIGGDGINYSWSLNSGELPPGLGFTLLTPSILSTTAALHGTPTAAGMYNFNLKVVSNGQAVFKDFSLLIQEPTALTVTSPNGGESWEPEAIHDVTWSVAGDTSALDHFSLYYTVDGGNSWEFMGFAPNADRSFSWTVPDRFSSRAKVIVYAMDITSHMLAYDASDSFFTIAPDGAGTLPAVSLIHPSAEAWTAGTTQTISWSVAGSLPGSFHHYSVYASLQGGRNGSWFNVGYSATPSLLWDIPATIGSAGAKIVVYAMDSLSHSLSDALPADFVIVPATGAYGITITAPAGGTPLHVGANTSVTWAVTGFLPPQVSSYQVFYSVDGGLSWELAGASAASPFSWTVPARLSTACSLMVVAMDGSANVLGIGISATFTISP